MSGLSKMARGAAIVAPTGHIHLLAIDDVVMIWRDETETRHLVPNYGTSIGELAMRDGFTVGWAQLPDGCEVVYLYDRDDDNFGYAINLDAPSCSEWGYAPFVIAS